MSQPSISWKDVVAQAANLYLPKKACKIIFGSGRPIKDKGLTRRISPCVVITESKKYIPFWFGKFDEDPGQLAERDFKRQSIK